ncbi:MAG: AAA family ATPase [Gemmatimonadaceae bacterium]|nr:AAA family ATPase [Gemmatimonadaceae bacterium]
MLKLKRLGVPVEAAGKSGVAISSSLVACDIDDFMSAGAISESPSLDRYVVLPGYEPSLSPPFLEWLDGLRSRVTSSAAHLILEAISRHRGMGQWVEVECHARCLLQMSPLNEEGTLVLAEAFAMRGAKRDATLLLDRYLNEIGEPRSELRLQASLLRRRIAAHSHPQVRVAATDTPFIGRGELLNDLGKAFSEVQDGRGQAYLLWGDAGIGKSRLLAEACAFADLQGLATHRVQCRPSDAHRPLSIFIDLVPALRTMRGSIGCAPETVTYLDRLTQRRPSTVRLGDGGADDEFVYARVQQSLFDLVDAVSDETPLILLVEDVHWIDAASAMLLKDMLEWIRTKSVLFAFSARSSVADKISYSPSALRVSHVPPLTSIDSAEVVLTVVRQYQRTIDDCYLQWCISVAEGNPYFLHELAKQWIETGDQHSPPPSLTAVIERRLSRLDDEALQLLQACVVLEKNSTIERIERLLGTTPSQLLRSINALGTAGMLVLETRDRAPTSSTQLRSKHELLSGAALALLTSPALAFLHQRASLILEAEIDAEMSAAILWDCAKHWQLAGNNKRAFDLVTSCAEHLMDVGLPSMAADVYDRAFAYTTSDRQRFAILERQTHSYYRSSAWQDLIGVATKARAYKTALEPNATDHDDIELMQFRAEWQGLDWSATRKKAMRCLTAHESSALHRVEAGTMVLMLLGLECDPAGMASVFEVVEPLCHLPEVPAAAGNQVRMVYNTNCGDWSAAVAAAEALTPQGTSSDNIGEHFRNLCNASICYRGAGLFDKSRSSLFASLALADKHNVQLSKHRAIPMLIHLELELGNNEAATHWFDELLEIPLPVDDKFAAQEIKVIRARLALLGGDHRLAERNLPNQMPQIATDLVYHRRTYQAALAIATDLAAGATIPRENLAILIDSHTRSRVNLHQAFATYVLHAALHREGRGEEAREMLGEYTNRYRREPWAAPSHFLTSIVVA